MDKLVSKIAALGIPGLVLVTAIGATGLAGGAAITTALAALGRRNIRWNSYIRYNWSYFRRHSSIWSGCYIFCCYKRIISKRRNKGRNIAEDKKISYFQRIKTKIKRKYRKSIKGSLTLMHKIKAVKIYVEFYSFLCIIEVAETI